MVEYRNGNKNDTEKLSAMRVSMLCESNNHSDDFRSELYQSTLDYLNKGLCDGSVSLIIATENEEIVAMSCMNYFVLPPNEISLSGKSAYLGNMYTVPEFRNRGIASMLLTLVLEEARHEHCDRIVLVPTEMGKALYNKFNFQPWFDAMVFLSAK